MIALLDYKLIKFYFTKQTFLELFPNNSPHPHYIVLIFNALQQDLNCAYLFICAQKSKKSEIAQLFQLLRPRLTDFIYI